MAADEERFTALYRRHVADIERYVRRRAADTSVLDVVSEVFTVAWRRLGVVPDPALPWLYGVARRVIANNVRGAHRADRLRDRLSVVDTSTPDHSEAVAGRLTVAAAFDELPETDREVLRLIAWEGLSIRDAATAAGCGKAAFAMRLHRARHRLRRALDAQPDSPIESISVPEGERR